MCVQKFIHIIVRLLAVVIASNPVAASAQVVFDYSAGEAGNQRHLRLPKVERQVKALLYAHQNMTEEVLFRSREFTARMDTLGVAMAFIQKGSQNWDVSDGCQQRFESIIKEFADSSGHPEITCAPVIPFGHSAQATFPWNFAAWNPERTLCILSFHGDAPRTNLTGYGRENIEWGRTRNIDSIPGLMIMGEYEWWEARLRPALAFRMMYPDSRISFFCDAGKGHFDLCDDTLDYMADFIEKALADPRPKDGSYFSRWNDDGTESTDVHDMFWYQDQEMIERTKRRYEESLKKKEQYLGARINGRIVEYNKDSHIKMNAVHEGDEFEIVPFYSDESRSEKSPEHGKATPYVRIISGPVIQTGDHTFRYDPDYFGFDPGRLWSGITLILEADGDDVYKSAVQEINIHLSSSKQ